MFRSQMGPTGAEGHSFRQPQVAHIAGYALPEIGLWLVLEEQNAGFRARLRADEPARWRRLCAAWLDPGGVV